MPRTMIWLATVIRVAIVPVLVGAAVLLVKSPQTPSDLAVAAGLVLLSAIHVLYWWRPWPNRQRGAVAALAGMVLINFVLLNLLGLAEPLVWLYPALIAGFGLRMPAAAVGVGLTALAAAALLALEGSLIHPIDPVHPAAAGKAGRTQPRRSGTGRARQRLAVKSGRFSPVQATPDYSVRWARAWFELRLARPRASPSAQSLWPLPGASARRPRNGRRMRSHRRRRWCVRR